MTLARPNDKTLQGEEVEIVKLLSKQNKIYLVHVLRPNILCNAGEHQLENLPDGRAMSSWEKCAWRPNQ